MWTGLLPGLRELRSPLTQGLLWFFFFWLWLGDSFPDDLPDPLDRVEELARDAEAPTVAAVVLVAAYLFGSILDQGTSPLHLWLSGCIQRFCGPREKWRPPKYVEAAAERVLLDVRLALIDAQTSGLNCIRICFEWLHQDLLTTEEVDSDPFAFYTAPENKDGAESFVRTWASVGLIAERMVRHIESDLDAHPPKAYAVRGDEIEEVRRLNAEAEFREAFLLPSLAVGILLAAEVSGWFVLIPAAAIGLFADAAWRRLQAARLIRRQVFDGVTEPLFFSRIPYTLRRL